MLKISPFLQNPWIVTVSFDYIYAQKKHPWQEWIQNLFT